MEDNFNFKSSRREKKSRKEWDNETLGVRTSSIRVGEGLVTFEVKRKTKMGKARKERQAQRDSKSFRFIEE